MAGGLCGGCINLDVKALLRAPHDALRREWHIWAGCGINRDHHRRRAPDGRDAQEAMMAELLTDADLQLSEDERS